MARHGGLPVGSAARNATARPYVGLHRTHSHPPGSHVHTRPDVVCPCAGCRDDYRMRAAGMVWDEARQDWIPDPAIWGEPDDPPRCLSCGHLEADECGCRCCEWGNDEWNPDA